MKIVVLDEGGVNPGDLSWEEVEKIGTVTRYMEKSPETETIRRIGDSEIVVTCKTLITKKVLDECRNMKMIAVLSTGYDIVDVAAAAEKKIPVCNVPTYATDAVAQFTFGLILEICHRIGDHSLSVHAGDWSKQPYFCYWLSPQEALSGKTLGIIGYGKIGRRVAEIAKVFGMKVIWHSPHAEGSVSLPELLKQSDIISLNARLTAETRGLINAGTIAKMKDGAWLINTGRGPLLNETDVAAALNSGKLGAAAVDVVDGEPISPENPLLKAKNCIITPHIAWTPKECRQRLIDVTADNINGFLEGNIINAVY